MLTLLRPRGKKLSEFVDQLTPFFVDPQSYDAEGVKKHLSAPEMPGHLRALIDQFAGIGSWTESELEQALRAVADARGVKAGPLIHATRLALTGRMVSPGLFEMLALVGRERALARLNRLADVLEGG